MSLSRKTTLGVCWLVLAGSALTTSTTAQANHLGNSRPTSITETGPCVAMFAAADDMHGVEVWQSDGTMAGTVPVHDIEPGGRGSYPADFTPIPTVGVFFTATTEAEGRELYVRGTTCGAAPVCELPIRTPPGAGTDPMGSDPIELTAVGGRLFFTADDGMRGRELWVSDGTGPGTRIVRDIVPGPTGSKPYGLTALASIVVFAATDAGGDTEIWTSDGTPAGTRRIDVHPRASSTPSCLMLFDDEVYFAALVPTAGRELCKTDGTAAGTMLVHDIRGGPQGSHPTQLVASASHLALTADDGINGRELFTLDAADVLTRVSMLTMGHTIANLTPVSWPATIFYFTVDDPAIGNELWGSLPSGPAIVAADIHPTGSSGPTNLSPADPGVVFRADDGTTGAELWSFGVGGAARVRNIKGPVAPGCPPRGSAVSALTRIAPQEWLFSAEDDEGLEPWKLVFDPLSGAPGTAQRVAQLDLRQPLPELASERISGAIQLRLSDADPRQPWILLLGFAQPAAPIVYPFLPIRGAFMVDPLAATTLILGPLPPTDSCGNASGPVVILPQAVNPIPLAWQAVSWIAPDGADVAETSTNVSCTNVASFTTPAGATVQAGTEGCLNDDTGEYQIEVRRIDANPGTAYVVPVRAKPTGELVPLLPRETTWGNGGCPIKSGESLFINGTLDVFTPVGPDDPAADGADKLWLLLYDNPPAFDDLSGSNAIWMSYC